MTKSIHCQMYKAEAQPDGSCMVYSRATAEELDKANEVLDYALSVPEFEKWRDDALTRSQGKSLGNIRAMHGKIAAGKATQITFLPEEKAIDVLAHVIDTNEARKCIEGVYTGMSIGGDYLKRWPDPVIKNAIRYVPTLSEISLVDNPCVPSATFMAVKLDGSSELRKFVATESDPLEKKLDQPRASSSKFSVARDQSGAIKWGDIHRGMAVKARTDGNESEAKMHEAEAASHDADHSTVEPETTAILHDKAAAAHKTVAEGCRAAGDSAGEVLHEARAAGHEDNAATARALKMVVGLLAKDGEAGISTETGLNFHDQDSTPGAEAATRKCACGGEVSAGKCGKCGEVVKAAPVRITVGFPVDGSAAKVSEVSFAKSDWSDTNVGQWLTSHGFDPQPLNDMPERYQFQASEPADYSHVRILDGKAARPADLIKDAGQEKPIAAPQPISEQKGEPMPTEKVFTIPEGLGKLRKAAATVFAQNYIEKTFARGIKKRAAELSKSMYDVQNMADMLCRLAWMVESLKDERVYENDDSKLPDQLRALVLSLKQFFLDLAEEESNELIREEAEKAAPAPVAKAAGSVTEPGGGRMAIELTKLADRLSKATPEQLNKFTEGLLKAASHLTKAKAGMEKAMDHHEKMGDHLDDMKDHIDELCGKAVGDGELQKSMAEEAKGIKDLYAGVKTAHEGIGEAHDLVHGALEEMEDDAESDVDAGISASEKMAKMQRANQKAMVKMQRDNQKAIQKMQKSHEHQLEQIVGGLVGGFTKAAQPATSIQQVPARTAPAIAVNKTDDGTDRPGQVVKSDGVATVDSTVSAVSPVLRDGVTPNPEFVKLSSSRGEALEKALHDTLPQTGDPFVGLHELMGKTA